MWVYGVNMFFSALSIFHLTYLGSLFDSEMDNMHAEEVSDLKKKSLFLFIFYMDFLICNLIINSILN